MTGNPREEPGRCTAHDAPLSLLASGHDGAVPYECVNLTADLAESKGTDVERLFYPDESLHAMKLYAAHQADVDARWAAFLIDHLGL